jgi:hypothetical protein
VNVEDRNIMVNPRWETGSCHPETRSVAGTAASWTLFYGIRVATEVVARGVKPDRMS